MDLTEFIRFVSDYGFVPNLFKVGHAKELFASANLGAQRDSQRCHLSFNEFEFAVKRSIAEAFALASGRRLPEGVTALWELLHENNTPTQSIIPSSPTSLSFRPLSVMGYQEDASRPSTQVEAWPEHREVDVEAELSEARVEVQERAEMLSLLADAPGSPTGVVLLIETFAIFSINFTTHD